MMVFSLTITLFYFNGILLFTTESLMYIIITICHQNNKTLFLTTTKNRHLFDVLTCGIKRNKMIGHVKNNFTLMYICASGTYISKAAKFNKRSRPLKFN